MKSKSLSSLIAAFLLVNMSLALQGSIAFGRASTRLHYKEEFVVAQQATSSDQQEGVDVYLEFLHNRYSRMNTESDQAIRYDGRNYPFKWLTQSENFDDVNNALEVLGLSSLASEKLLHKFHMTSSTPAIRNESLSTFSKIMDAIFVTRKNFIALQEAKLRALFLVLLNAFKAGPYALKKLIALGGGKKSMLISMSVASVFLFSVVRPLSTTVFRDTLQQVTRA